MIFFFLYPSNSLSLEHNIGPPMLSTTPLFREGKYQTNLIECKDRRGLAIRFHFEVVDTTSCKCLGIFDRVTEAKLVMDKLAMKSEIEKPIQVKAG